MKLLTSPPAPLPAARVLLVEDNAVNRMLATRMLETLGIAVLEAHDGEEALDCLHGPDGATVAAVLMDCQMPGIDGFEATRRWRAHEAARGAVRLPIVALTANVLPDDIAECKAAGMDAHLGKPFSIADLRAVLQPVLAAD
jgi:CheY-like chemotaxis protein